MDDKPAFEVIDGAHIYRIWADGRIDGFPADCGVINRIPQVVAEAIGDSLQHIADSENIIEGV